MLPPRQRHDRPESERSIPKIEEEGELVVTRLALAHRSAKRKVARSAIAGRGRSVEDAAMNHGFAPF
jgi:hypothetical protein